MQLAIFPLMWIKGMDSPSRWDGRISEFFSADSNFSTLTKDAAADKRIEGVFFSPDEKEPAKAWDQEGCR